MKKLDEYKIQDEVEFEHWKSQWKLGMPVPQKMLKHIHEVIFPKMIEQMDELLSLPKNKK